MSTTTTNSTNSKGNYTFEKLGANNYAYWMLKMKMTLIREKSWGVVDGSEAKPVDPESVRRGLKT